MRFKRKRVFVIGIPHLNWKLLDLMIKSGKFKGFERLIKDGSFGKIVPQEDKCSSPVEFTSMITGVKKEKHSIGHGEHSDKEYIENGRLYTRLDIKTKTIWEIALENKRKVGLYHWLLTWPPKKIKGFMVTGRLSQDGNKTYPKKLRKVLEYSDPDSPDFFDHRAALMLIKKYDIDLFLGMEERAHGPIHIFWEDVESDKIEEKESFFNYFKYMDLFLGKILEEFQDATIIIVSDSGMKLRDYPIYTVGNEIIELSGKLGIDLQFYAMDIYPPCEPKAKPVFHIPGKTQEEKERMKTILSGIKYKDGKKFIKDIIWKYDDFSFSFNFYPSFIDDKCGWINLVLPNGEDFRIWVIKQTGASLPIGGVFIAKGPLIKEDFDVGQVNTIDISPTVLYLLGLSIPENIEGNILGEMLR